MEIKLYGTPPSPPSHSARLMLERKGLDHKLIWLLPGLWPALLRTRGFRGGTVPAMKIDGRRIQGSLLISRELEQLKREPALFPSDPERKRAGSRLSCSSSRETGGRELHARRRADLDR